MIGLRHKKRSRLKKQEKLYAYWSGYKKACRTEGLYSFGTRMDFLVKAHKLLEDGVNPDFLIRKSSGELPFLQRITSYYNKDVTDDEFALLIIEHWPDVNLPIRWRAKKTKSLDMEKGPIIFFCLGRSSLLLACLERGANPNGILRVETVKNEEDFIEFTPLHSLAEWCLDHEEQYECLDILLPISDLSILACANVTPLEEAKIGERDALVIEKIASEHVKRMQVYFYIGLGLLYPSVMVINHFLLLELSK